MEEFTFKCPFCNVEYDGLDFLDTGDMSGEFEVVCDNCNELFNVEFKTTIKFECKI